MKDAQFVCPHCGEELKSRWKLESDPPKEDGTYIVSVIRNRPIRFPDWETRDVYECVYTEEAGWHTANDVIAWMPLPEPYKED